MFLQSNKCSFDCSLSIANKMPKIGVDKIFFLEKSMDYYLKKKKRKRKKCLKHEITINFKFSKV